jgi:hypothetical protein
MSHQVIIIKGTTDDGQQNIEVQYTPPESLNDEDARKEARKWVKWVKNQYDNNYSDHT